MKIKLEALLDMKLGQIVGMTNDFLKENPDFKTADELLKEKAAA